MGRPMFLKLRQHAIRLLYIKAPSREFSAFKQSKYAKITNKMINYLTVIFCITSQNLNRP